MVGSMMIQSTRTCQLVARRSRALAWRPRGRLGAGHPKAFARVATEEVETKEVVEPIEVEVATPSSTEEPNLEDGNVVKFAGSIDVSTAETVLEDIVVPRALEDYAETRVGAKEGGVLASAWNSITGLFDWSARARGLVLLNVMTLIMATNWVVVKDAETMLDPFTFSALRFTVAVLAFIPFLKKETKVSPDVLKAGVELGAWFSLGYITQSVGLLTTDASRASFLSAFTVILVPIITGVTGKGVSKQTWLAAFVALFGTALLEQGGGSDPGIGDVYNLLSAAFFAIQIIRTEHYSRDLTSNTTELLATSLATTAVISGALAIGTHPSETLALLQNFSTVSLSGVPWNEVLYTGVMSTDIVLLIELVALHDVASTDAAIVYTMEPVLGAMLAYFILGDRWGPAGWVGAALILVSSLTTQLMGTGDENEGLEKNAGDS